MSSDLSKYLGNKLAQWFAGTDMPSAPASCYAALYNGDPKTSGSEVTTDVRGAGRVAITWDSIADDGSDNTLATDADADFGNSDGDATVTHVAVMDAASSGHILGSRALTGGTATITTGTPVKILSGDLTLTLGS